MQKLHITSSVLAGSLGCAFLGLTCLCGCDFRAAEEKKEKKIVQLEKQLADKSSAAQQNLATALTTYIKARCQMELDKLSALTNRCAALDRDAAELNAAIDHAMLSGGQDARIEVKLERALMDEKVNAFAEKYLHTRFTVQCETFKTRAAEARRQMEAYEQAVRQSEESFKSRLAGANNWQSSTKEEREREIKRLEAEITTLERLQRNTRNSLQGTSSEQARERREKERTYADQIRQKHRQIDEIRSLNYVRQVESVVVREQQNVHDRARTIKRDEIKDIERRLRPQTTIADVVRETTRDTLDALRAAIRSERGSVMPRQIEETEAKARLAQNFLLEIPICDEAELKSLRSRVEKALSTEAR